MTSRRAIPARITWALDARGLHGPQVDLACEAREPAVDMWEANRGWPTERQVQLLAKLTDYPVEYFYTPLEPEEMQGQTFVCKRGGKGKGSTVIVWHVDAAGVLHSTANGKRLHPHADPPPQNTLF